VDLAARATVRVAEFVRAMRSQTTVERAEAQSRFSVVERIAPIERLMTHGLRKAGIRLEVVGDPATFATGDPGRLDQVLTNLIQNAADSIAESGVGETIRIEVKRMEDDAVAIIVEDNGPGIPDSVRARVFDYLFTTRAQSGGTGIGLALCRDIVVGEFGGCLDLREVAGPHGARFEITLGKPAAPTETSAFQPAQQFAPTANRVELRG
jgi:two-component system C4-dicarboxylate transport sensor histidine kinase DctB